MGITSQSLLTYPEIYMLHYVDKEDVGALKIQNTCFELYNLIECFYEAYQVKQQVA